MGSPFVRFQQTQRTRPGMAWLVMLPGIFLTIMALAILLWPELLAYMVAGVLLFGGISLISWGWTLHRARSAQSNQSTYVQYDVY
ncbi:MAG: hypothetical protein R2932_40165 [Caldilineaceae bacterium]